MIHILLMILKIIGIILLVILGILLVVLSAVLLVPVRYRVLGSWHGKPELEAKATWLLHILSFRAVYTDGGLKTVLRVFGYNLFKARDKNPAEDVIKGTESVLNGEEQALQDELMEDEARFRKAAEERRAGGGKDDGGMRSREDTGGRGDAKSPDDSGGRGNAKAPDDTGGRGNAKAPDDTESRTATEEDDAPLGRAGSLFRRIKTKLENIWKNLKFSFTKFCDKLKGIREFTEDKKRWLEDEKNQASLKLLFRQAKRLIAHIWPVKGKGTVTFGFDDPYTTGQVLQAVSLIYPFYHRQLVIHPVFDEQVIDAEGSFRGRIRLAFVLWLAFQVFWDKHTRRMIRGFIK